MENRKEIPRVLKSLVQSICKYVSNESKATSVYDSSSLDLKQVVVRGGTLVARYCVGQRRFVQVGRPHYATPRLHPLLRYSTSVHQKQQETDLANRYRLSTNT